MGIGKGNPAVERLKAAVIDSSVLLKWFRVDEPYAETAEALRQAYLDDRVDLTIPDLATYEVANVMRYRSPSNAAAAVETLFDLQIPMVRLDHALLQRVVRTAARYEVTVYDATFLAVAETLRLQLVTADKRFYRAIRALPGTFFLSDLKLG